MIPNKHSIVQQFKADRTIKHVNVNVNIIVNAKKDIVGILAHVSVRIVSIEKVLLILQ